MIYVILIQCPFKWKDFVFKTPSKHFIRYFFFHYVTFDLHRNALLCSDSRKAANEIHIDITTNQGNLKGESVVAAILPSRMEVSYCTSRFFRS